MPLSVLDLATDMQRCIVSDLAPLDVLALRGTNRLFRDLIWGSVPLELACYDAATTTLWLRARFEIPWAVRHAVDDATLIALVTLFRPGVTRLVLQGLPNVRLELEGLPPLRQLEVRACPLLCLSPGVAGLLAIGDGIESVLGKGAARWCHLCPSEAYGGCAECGKPACLGDPDGYWEADGHCSEVVECLSTAARTSASTVQPLGPGLWTGHGFQVPRVPPLDLAPCERAALPLESAVLGASCVECTFYMARLMLRLERSSERRERLPTVGRLARETISRSVVPHRRGARARDVRLRSQVWCPKKRCQGGNSSCHSLPHTPSSTAHALDTSPSGHPLLSGPPT